LKSEIDWNHTNKIVSRALYSGLAKILYNKTHRHLAKFGNKNSKKSDKILEIGSGRGEHLIFVRDNFSEYFMTDLTDWGLKEISLITESDERIKFMKQDIENLDFSNNFFDRVIVSCVISHVNEPYQAMMELRRVVKNGGTISFLISADPGILLRSVRALMTKPKMKKLAHPYSLVNAISHRNSANGLIVMAKWVFRKDDVSICYYPLHIPSWNFSTHIIVNIKVK
jgi:phosphatidylethanolamine/phosphatidyl-N-methylethanolamine N-methyltransferase